MSQTISADRPLATINALENDRLSRRGFAEAAVQALSRVSNEAGFVISIEGPWGSGKTSVLAMMEQIIRKERGQEPIFVHFNPWLVGDRNALVRQFFLSVSKALNLRDNIAEVEKASKALTNYAKVFDFIGYIPGAEPFAGPIRKVINAAGEALGGISEEKKRDLEGSKKLLEKELVALGRKIYVFIDDIDRLYPDEVYEMVRIVKAVGELPNVGYVLAIDSAYVSSALMSANVPQASTFIDKIVQIRLPVPAISIQMRSELLDHHLRTLEPGAFGPYFADQDARMHSLYFHGVRDALEHPRDIARVVNTLSVIEPALRGEVVFADIFSLACLMVKAPNVYDELRRQPGLFTGEALRGRLWDEDDKKKRAQSVQARVDELCATSSHPQAIRGIVKFLFPKAFGNSFSDVSSVEGHIGAPDRLAIALGQAIGTADVSLKEARQFILQAEARNQIGERLTKANSLEFFERVGDVAATLEAQQLQDVCNLCVELACLVDTLSREGRLGDRVIFGLDAEGYVRRSINKIAESKSDQDEQESAQLKGEIAAKVVSDGRAISMAADILLSSIRDQAGDALSVPRADIAAMSARHADNVIQSINDDWFWLSTNPARIIWSLMRIAKNDWPRVFEAIKQDDPTLDRFALEFLKSAFSSDGGQSYAVPRDEGIRSVLDLDSFREHAQERLDDPHLTKVTRNAWRSVVEGRPIFGESGKYSQDF